MRSLFRVTFYRDYNQVQENVVAATPGAAASHLGVTQPITVSEIVHNVEVSGVDPDHPKLLPTPVNVLPPYVPHFSSAEVARLEALLSPAAVAQLRAKLTPEEIADLRVRQLTEAEVADLKIELQTREPHNLSFRHA